jgi:hypothetical protein
MDRRGLVLFGFGVVLLSLSVRMGGLSRGYGVGPASVFLRVATAYTTLGVLTIAFRPTTTRKLISNAIATLAVVFLVGATVMHLDVGMQPPEHGSPLTIPRLLVAQLELLLLTLPVPAGYLSGSLLRERTTDAAAGCFLTAAAVGYFGGTTVSVARGTAPGFTHAMFGAAILATTAFALLPLSVMRLIPPTPG